MPVISLSYGGAFVAIGFALSFGLWRTGYESLIPVVAGCFAIVGPLMAVGLYEASRCRAAAAPVSLGEILFVKTASPLQLLYVGFVILFALLVWGRIAIMLYALFASSTYMPIADFSAFVLGTGQGLAMLLIGSIIGAGIAFAIFALTAFSIPLLMDQKTDIFTAVVASVAAVARNPGAMVLWAWLIAIFCAVGLATAFIGLVVIFPLLGYATWHAYRETFPNV